MRIENIFDKVIWKLSKSKEGNRYPNTGIREPKQVEQNRPTPRHIMI